MEMWQQQGFESFGAWRRATERARRAVKKTATRPVLDLAIIAMGRQCGLPSGSCNITTKVLTSSLAEAARSNEVDKEATVAEWIVATVAKAR